MATQVNPFRIDVILFLEVIQRTKNIGYLTIKAFMKTGAFIPAAQGRIHHDNPCIAEALADWSLSGVAEAHAVSSMPLEKLPKSKRFLNHFMASRSPWSLQTP